MIYFLVISFVVAAALTEGYVTKAFGPACVSWLKHIALSMGSVALFWSFTLPFVIRKTQLERLDEDVKKCWAGESSPA